MDVLLINPYDQNAVKNGLGFISPPINLMYLGGALENANYDVCIIDDDLEQLGYKELSKIISKQGPNIIGITATTSSVKNALEYVKLTKEILPDSVTVMGGPHTSFMPVETLKSCSSLDAVVIGEGEETMIDLVSKYIDENNGKLAEIKGIAYKDGKNGNIKINPSRPLIKDLDSIPFPARHLVPFESYKTTQEKSSDMITSRGCVFNCDYCSSSLIMGKKFRTRSPENVVDEIEHLIDRYKLENIAFMDDTFMLNKIRANDIADEIKDRRLDISFVASSRVDMVDKNLLMKLKKAGLKTLYYGVESGSQRVLDLMKKGITLKQAEEAVKSAKEVGLEVLTSFILGFPGETLEEINKTINFSIKLNADYSQYSILTPFPGTPIYYELKRKKLIETENWNKYTVLKSVIKYEELGLSKKLVQRKLAQAYFKFYSRPKYLLKHRYMFKILVETILRAFILPQLNGRSPQGWYKTLADKSS
ncbi:MAG: B12-binding domain-containing radical SAM protein [Methanobacterium sp.]|nr:B12-binding domain-containing radical SAM protein [Methanobacterium sp.]